MVADLPLPETLICDVICYSHRLGLSGAGGSLKTSVHNPTLLRIVFHRFLSVNKKKVLATPEYPPPLSSFEPKIIL
jgi:hypothetical protein